MAKNTSSSTFRKIDVDQYNEDNFILEDESDSGKKGPDENEISGLLSVGKYNEALLNVLQNAPLDCKNQQIKDHALNIALKVLLSIKYSQMDSAINTLEQHNLLDVLMKYIYRGFEKPSEGSSGHLLQWHEKTFAKSGVGSIVRVLTDTNRA
ncbi:actin-related protein 2/3 complex subunit 5-C [Condylostylus longicornis]|uniref:actin-related protein 2/3 complex subunit 5-C n=1 Tax=Condylostylus longicornis TaxID=2530218 RepID=UPI00244E3CD7|nr:actin-related protein 2/3 complex subunit 5-C [Condylostylus longicornis]XP_055371557.1 actin-related protein 2/3 complex subunit 5-C [Condylostylus longicornis]